MLTVQFEEGDAIVWETTADSARPERHAYTPALFVGGPSKARTHVRAALADDPKVASLDTVHRYPDLHADEREPVLRVAVERVGEIRTLAREIRTRHEAGSFAPGTLRLYDVDLDPGARYCLDTGRSPVPDRDLRTLALDLPAAARADDDLSGLRIDGDPVSGGEARTLAALADRLERVDPDVLVCSTGRIVPLVVAAADRHGIDCPLGRRPGVTQRAGANTVESYGRVLHSPARYAVPGRVIVDREGSFLYDEGGLPGLRDLAARSRRPLQATARGSIGTILTSIEIREARSRDVLVPWNKWEPEAFSPVPTLHDADRGGFTFAPAVGVHEDVIEVDFASLYPSIMVEYNVSPETVGCDCCANDRVPGLDYSICEERGFMADVLDPLIQDRADMKARIAADGIGDDEHERLEAQADALKWILVSSFGYQGYRNAKYGRIEAHEAINAVAREILLDAKDRLEAAGWRVVHGIVDSLWVTARDDPDPIEAVAADVSEAAGIDLEVEDHFDWVAFVPRKDSQAGALTRYFGRVADRNEYKRRGIAARRRSTCDYVADTQRALIETFDRERSPDPVCDRAQRAIDRLERGAVDPADLVIRTRATRDPGAYDRHPRTADALERAQRAGLAVGAGRDVRYIVSDDDRRGPERVRLPFEDGPVDAAFYADRVLGACEEVVSPLGWDRDRIERYLAGTRELGLAAFGE